MYKKTLSFLPKKKQQPQFVTASELPPLVRQSLERMTTYLFYEEMEDAYDEDGKAKPGHIFADVARLSLWLSDI